MGKSVDVSHLHVSYYGNEVVSDVSFSFDSGNIIGIIGPNGAGKSTLMKAMLGLIPKDKGEINFNGNAIKTVRKNIAYIPQQPYIFPLSLADNIRFYERVTSDAEIEQVIQDIGMQSFVNELPQGIHEPIGEGGRTLSGGQEQRVAIARALLSKRPIILLDEPTAHLDIETEYEIKQLMMQLFEHKLVFFATHRMHWMSQMDLLLMMDKGKIVEQGTHEELMKQNGTYMKLVSLQSFE